MSEVTEFNGTLAHALGFGHVLQIVAKTVDSASRCRISLLAAKLARDPTADVGLHFSIFFRENHIVRNARVKGIWGENEIELPNQKMPINPIRSGEFFMVYIFCGSDCFHIAIDNQPYCTFNYRLPVETLRCIEIRDQIQAIKQVDHRVVYPSPWPPIHASDYFKAFSSDSPILFRPGHVIIITARFFGNKKGQSIIKFMDSDTRRELLHFSIRFDEKVVVRNSMNKTFDFGPEERFGGFPFVFNQQFKLAIGFTNQEFLTSVDGNEFVGYGYAGDILHNLVGFKVTCINGLLVHVTGVDHVRAGDFTCSNIQDYSRHDYDI